MARSFGHSLSISFSSSERISCLMAAYANHIQLRLSADDVPFFELRCLPTAYACDIRHSHFRQLLAGMAWKERQIALVK